MLVWTVLGFPLAIAKAKHSHSLSWIGINLEVQDRRVVVTIPADKVKDLLDIVKEMGDENVIPVKRVRTLAGKCAHIASIIIVWRPFLNQLWAAISAPGNAPQNCVWLRQISTCLTWLERFLSAQRGSITRVYTHDAYFGHLRPIEVTTDASPYGIGGWVAENGVVTGYFLDAITPEDMRFLKREAGTSEGQQTWEALAILVALRLWRSKWQSQRISLRIRSDNVGALTLFAVLKGKSESLGLIAQEFALDLGDMTYVPDVISHLPGVANQIADILSRKFDPAKSEKWRLPDFLSQTPIFHPRRRDHSWWRTLSG